MFQTPMTRSLRAAAHPLAAVPMSTRARTSVNSFFSQHSARLFSTPCTRTQNSKRLTPSNRTLDRPCFPPSRSFASAKREPPSGSKEPKETGEPTSHQKLFNRIFTWKRIFLVIGVAGVLEWVTDTRVWKETQATAEELRNLTPLEREQHFRKKTYEKTLKQYGERILPKEHPHSIMADRVLQRLIPYAPVEGADWEVFVVKADAEMLAFCTPEGKLFLFTGIIPFCDDADGLAFLLAHEMSHIVAEHWKEKLEEGFKNYVGYLAPSLVDWSRSKERELEADSMGLMMMSKACFSPVAAVRFMRRIPGMHGIFVHNGVPKKVKVGPSHPGNLERITNLRAQMAGAHKVYENSKCGALESQVSKFQQGSKSLLWQN
ncbi:M48 family metallopeptidase [Aspergillus stella-maris]|uniref:M48 family metallopeptidase n=1 Tax=Aspergillus stella-maris TaxID=1810926 RepID=UPI003CCD8257